LSETECQDQLGRPKQTLVRLHRADVEARLSSVMWLTSNEIAVIQSLVFHTVRLPAPRCW